MELGNVHEEAVKVFGINGRLLKLKEEVSELAEALDNVLESTYNTDENIRRMLEELADVNVVSASFLCNYDYRTHYVQAYTKGLKKLKFAIIIETTETE